MRQRGWVALRHRQRVQPGCDEASIERVDIRSGQLRELKVTESRFDVRSNCTVAGEGASTDEMSAAAAR